MRSMASRPKLLRAELQSAFLGESGKQFPVVLSPERLASLLGLSVKTIYVWISLGRLDGCFRKRGKHILLWRDRVIAKIFDGPDWTNDRDDNTK